MVAMLPPRSIADSGGDRLRVWVKPRGTTKLPSHLTSVLVPRDALIDDLKWHLKEEMAPLLEQVPKPLIHFYSYNETADDYLQQAPTRTLASNPNPAALKDAPGLESEHPLYWDYERMWPEPEK
eukprot:TRINITY_DN1916_c0_g1_i11.p1 TRINITY_DN1916_c0_g1~~TRINITY_DN1916_c0_g1_i11.p1  ORF type:complete len:144 (+),score=40.68 TRINITY_DN1916_c0_g1_i11:63-434(+)